jgi:hypothetical protein
VTSPADLPQYARIHQSAFLTTADGVVVFDGDVIWIGLEETKWLPPRDRLDRGHSGPVHP